MLALQSEISFVNLEIKTSKMDLKKKGGRGAFDLPLTNTKSWRWNWEAWSRDCSSSRRRGGPEGAVKKNARKRRIPSIPETKLDAYQSIYSFVSFLSGNGPKN